MSVNTDFERLLLDKKLEVLKEINDTKVKILKELYAVNTRIHTCYHDYVNDYNQIRYLLEQELVRIQNEHEKFKEEMRSLYGEFVTNIDEYIYRIFAPEFDKLNGLTTSINQAISKVNEALAKVADLEERMLTDKDVDDIVNQVVEGLSGFVTEETFNEFVTNISNLINESLVNPDWNEGDPSKKSHILNRTHYGNFEKISLYEKENFNVVFENYIVDNLNNGAYISKSKEEYNNLTDITSFIVTSYDINGNLISIHTLNKKTLPLLDYEYESTNNNRREYIPVDKMIVWGEPENETVIMTNDKTKVNLLFFMKPNDNHLYCSYSISPALISVSYYKGNIEKMLHSDYMGGNGENGFHLIKVGDEGKWVKPPLVSYTNLEFDYLYNNYLPKVNESNVAIKYFDLILDKPLTANKEYYFTIGISTCKLIVDENFNITTSLNETAVKIESYVENVLRVFVHTTNYKFKGSGNTVYFSIVDYTLVEHSEILTPKWLGGSPSNYNMPVFKDNEFLWVESPILASPNGTFYKLIIDDNGTLSATPLTTS